MLKSISLATLLCLPSFAVATKTVLNKEKILNIISLNNPFISTLTADSQKTRDKILSYESAFDTNIGMNVESKSYPYSESTFNSFYVEKPLENGTTVLLSHRKSSGTQEFNNIKTNSDGELVLGLKVPLLPLLNNTNTNKFNLEISQLDSQQKDLLVKEKMRKFYFDTLSSYYQFLYRSEMLTLETELLKNAYARYSYLTKQVAHGNSAPITLTEAQQVVTEREQRKNDAENNLNISLTDLSTNLNTTNEKLTHDFSLDTRMPEPTISLSLNDAIKNASTTLPELLFLNIETTKIQAESSLNQNNKYPDIDLSLNALQDYNNNNGIKVGVNVKFPIERSKYHSKQSELLSARLKNTADFEISSLNLKRNLNNIFNNQTTLKSNYLKILKEIELAELLEKGTSRQFELGQETIFTLNLRELKTLQTKQKKYESLYKQNIIALHIDKETGLFDQFFKN